MDLIVGQQISRYSLRKATYNKIRRIFPLNLISTYNLLSLIRPIHAAYTYVYAYR